MYNVWIKLRILLLLNKQNVCSQEQSNKRIFMKYDCVVVCTNDFVYNGTLISCFFTALSLFACVCAVEVAWMAIHLALVNCCLKRFCDGQMSFWVRFVRKNNSKHWVLSRTKEDWIYQTIEDLKSVSFYSASSCLRVLINKNNGENLKLICRHMTEM